MRVDERVARWAVLGVASGEPLTALAVAAGLNALAALLPLDDDRPDLVLSLLLPALSREDPSYTVVSPSPRLFLSVSRSGVSPSHG